MRADRWPGVELRHFAALKAIADERSFNRAARRLGYTQSAISQQISVLERAVGLRLVERPGGPHKVTLTTAGKVLLRHAEELADRLAAAEADLAALSAGGRGVLELGTYQSAGAAILPEVLRELAHEWPDIEVKLTEARTDGELLDLVERGRIDITFCVFPVGHGPFETIQLLQDPYVLVLPRAWPIAASVGLGLPEEISQIPLIGWGHCRSLPAVEAALRAAGAEPKLVYRSDDNRTIQNLVAAGVAGALVPRLAVDVDDERVAIVDLGPNIPRRIVALAWHKERAQAPAVRAFIEITSAFAQRLQDEPGSRTPNPTTVAR